MIRRSLALAGHAHPPKNPPVMRSRPTFLFPIALLLACVAMRAQANNYGLTVSSRGTTAGQSCNTGSCSLAALGTFPNSQVDVTVWGNPGSLYAIGVSGQGLLCQVMPGVLNLYMLDNSPETLAIGRIPSTNPQIGDCGAPQFGARHQLTVPPGASTLVFRFQGIAVGGRPNSLVAFTGAVDMTVF